MKKGELIKKDLEYVWHPYTQMKDCADFPPIPIKRAEGVKLYDHDGNFYYDTISSWWCNVHGHGHPAIKKAIKDQLELLEHVLFAGFTHEPAINLAERLVELAPSGLNKVFFSDNGSTAVEIALKMSFQYWKNTGRSEKEKFVSLDMAYHGDTVGAMSVSGVGPFNRVFEPLFFGSYKVPAPYCYRCPLSKRRESCSLDCLTKVEEVLKENSGNIAALILEPMLLGAGGMIVYPAEYLSGVRAVTREYGVHLIVDEVATGFGRTGKMFASEHALVEPEFMCLSKGITSGYLPLAATLTTGDIYGAFYADYKEGKTFFHGHTYTANPIACRAALSSIELFVKEDTLENVSHISTRMAAFLEDISSFRAVGDVRGIGAIGAIEIVKDKETKEPFSAEERIGFKVYREGLKRNLILRPLGDVIYLFLPLCVSGTELDDILERTWDAIYNVWQ